MSSRDAERCPDVPGLSARLEAYYSRYYDDALGIPGWRELVAVRLDDAAYERERLARLAGALGRRDAGRRLLNVACGTRGFSPLGPTDRVHSHAAPADACRVSCPRRGGGRACDPRRR